MPRAVTKLDYTYAADALAAKAGVNADILSALINAESAWNPDAVSSTGATGLGQWTTGTALDYGLVGTGFDHRTDAALNLTATVMYLRDLISQYPTWRVAIGHYSGQGDALAGYAAYSAGQALITVIDAADGVIGPAPPPPPTTTPPPPPGDSPGAYVGTLQNSTGQSMTASVTPVVSPAATPASRSGIVGAVGGGIVAAMLVGLAVMAPTSPAVTAQATIPQVSAGASSFLPERSGPARLFDPPDAGTPQQSVGRAPCVPNDIRKPLNPSPC